jgi:pilus assembly protein CpaE
MPTRILTVDDDEFNRRLVAAALTRLGYDVSTASNGREALSLVEEIKPDLILLDVMMPDMDGYDVCKQLRGIRSSAHTPIMMLTALDGVNEKIKGFEAGADDYLSKPFEPAELQARVLALLRRASTPRREEMDQGVDGKIIAVFSLRGGVGVSTLAANLTIGLTSIWDQPAVLVDQVFMGGQGALMLNLPFTRTWSDLSHLPVEEIDLEVVESVLLTHDSGARVLAAPSRPEQAETISVEKVTQVLKVLSRRFPYMILDLPHDFYETTLAGLDASHEILALLAPDLASVRGMVCALETFQVLGYPKEKIRIGLNWTFQRHGLARKDIETALKRPIDLVIPFAPEPTVGAINLGKPPAYNEPNSPLGSLFEDLAFFFSDPEQKKQRPAVQTEAWGRVVQRFQKRQTERKG